jgi:hypothetical protein
LQKEITNTRDDLQKKLDKLEKAYTILIQMGDQDDLLGQVHDLQIGLKEKMLVIDGDQVQARRAEFVAPGLLGRARRATRADWNSSGPTQTHQESYVAAAEGLEALKKDMIPMDQAWIVVEEGMKNLGIW